MATVSTLIGLWAETSLHAGAGSSVDGIDLPIQREAHNGFPCVFGSSVKGALRAKAEDKWGTNNSVRYVFGPSAKPEKQAEGSTEAVITPADHAGALMVGDARLLLLPVRSLTGHFKWVTCPALLERLQRDITRLAVTQIAAYTIPQISTEESVLQVEEQSLFLEEYRLSPQADTKSELPAIITALSQLSGINESALQAQLAIVNDTMFSYLSRYATPVTAHIAIDNDKKVVREGALWYEETLPAETVLYVALAANSVRATKPSFNETVLKSADATAVLSSITDELFAQPAYLQIGGNETLGMGWCKVQTMQKGA